MAAAAVGMEMLLYARDVSLLLLKFVISFVPGDLPALTDCPSVSASPSVYPLSGVRSDIPAKHAKKQSAAGRLPVLLTSRLFRLVAQ